MTNALQLSCLLVHLASSIVNQATLVLHLANTQSVSHTQSHNHASAPTSFHTHASNLSIGHVFCSTFMGPGHVCSREAA